MLFQKLFKNPFVAILLIFCVLALVLNFRSPEVVKQETIVKLQDFKEGDIIFQVNQSGQGKAIQLATHSKYTHCGILFKENNKWLVYEAVQPVKKTSFEEWITHGENDFYEVKRLRNSAQVIDASTIINMKKKYNTFAGKPYDLFFGWSDEKIYCSELVWKIYKNATGLEVGNLQKLKDFDLTHPIVKAKLEERYGEKIPYDEMVISPAAIFDSELLETVSVE